MVKRDKIAIVGAGVGGLATAARLACRGYDVEVYEKLPECGGRAHIIEDKGFKFDTGPSFVLMPDFFHEIFSYCGQNLSDYLDFKMLDVSYKIFYGGGEETLTVYRNSNKTKEELEKFESGSSIAYDKYIAQLGMIYTKLKPFLYECMTPLRVFNPKYIKLAAGIRLFETYWQLAKKFFKNENLCYAFTFEAMFIGVSPYAAPAFYSIITYADHVDKIYHPMGGMYMIPKALEKLARKFGAKITYNRQINDLKEVEADKVVLNADYSYAYKNLLKRSLPKFDYSCSVYLIYLGLKKKIENLEHHNLFFSSDLRKNLSQIFREKKYPDDPSFYVHIPTVTDTSLAPSGKDIVYILVPVPNLEAGVDFDEEKIRQFVFNKINRAAGINLEDLIEVEHRFYPRDFLTRYNIFNGATFGLSHSLRQSAFLRPANQDRKNRNIYYTGASVQPGGGLPPVIASSRIVADMITL